MKCEVWAIARSWLLANSSNKLHYMHFKIKTTKIAISNLNSLDSESSVSRMVFICCWVFITHHHHLTTPQLHTHIHNFHQCHISNQFLIPQTVSDIKQMWFWWGYISLLHKALLLGSVFHCKCCHFPITATVNCYVSVIADEFVKGRKI